MTVEKRMDGSTIIIVSPADIWTSVGGAIYERALELASRDLADKLLTLHGDAILAKISPEAVANLATAHASAAVGKVIREGLDSLDGNRKRGWW